MNAADPRWIERTRAAVEALNRANEYAVGVLVTGMTAIVLLQVFRRYVLNAALLWPEEVARYLLIYITFLGSSAALARGEHVGVTYFAERMPVRLRPLVSLLVHLATATFLIIFLYYGWHVARVSATSHSQALGLSMFWVRLALPLGGALMGINLVRMLLDDVWALARGGDAG